MRRRVIATGLLVMTVSPGRVFSGNGADLELSDTFQMFQTSTVQLPPFGKAAVETLAFFDFEEGLPEGWETVDLTCESHWHATTTGAFEGYSYYCGIETPVGEGYLDLWEDYLETPEITIPGGTTSLSLTFVHKVDTESPEEPVWDGSAVFLSEDGSPFHIVFPQGGYTVDSLRAFEYRGQSGIPGWTGRGETWSIEAFDLIEYAENSTIQIRYTFASDLAVNSFTDFYTGVWVDEITLIGDGDTLFYDNGGDNGPAQMTFSNPCYGDLWTITADNIAINQRYGDPYYPPEGWTPGSLSVVCDDQPLINAALVSPAFTLPEEGYPRVSFYSLVEVPDYDGDGDFLLEDFFNVELSTAESNFLVWSSLFYDSGNYGKDSTWTVYDWNRDFRLRLHAYCGQQVKLRWRLHTDTDDDGGGGCDWVPCNGRGLFVDGFLLLQMHLPVYDVRITRIVVPFPNSVGHPIPIITELTNFGSYSVQLTLLYWELLDEDLNRVGDPPFFLFEPPYPHIAAGDTFQVAYDWTPIDTGNFYIRAIHSLCIDGPTCWDTMTTPVSIHVWEQKRAAMGYFDRFSTDSAYFDVQVGSGPAVKFSVPDFFSAGYTGLMSISLSGKALSGPVEVYVFGSGPDDSTFGFLLIEPFQFHIDGPIDHVKIDLTERQDSENLWDGGEDFWIHLRAIDQTEGQFMTRGDPVDSCRNWLYLDGALQPMVEAWEILALFENRPCAPGISRGDTNGDGNINILDVLVVANHIVDIQPLEGEAFCRADCNGDGTLDILDVLGITNVILGLGVCWWDK